MTVTTAADRRPPRYRIALELGWTWERLRGAAHLVPPQGDLARCGRLVPRGAREKVAQLTRQSTCAACRHQVGLP